MDNLLDFGDNKDTGVVHQKEVGDNLPVHQDTGVNSHQGSGIPLPNLAPIDNARVLALALALQKDAGVLALALQYNTEVNQVGNTAYTQVVNQNLKNQVSKHLALIRQTTSTYNDAYIAQQRESVGAIFDGMRIIGKDIDSRHETHLYILRSMHKEISSIHNNYTKVMEQMKNIHDLNKSFTFTNN